MTHLDIEINKLKAEAVEMFELVISQLQKSRVALIGNEKEMAREVNFVEKRVNALELKIDKDCENIFALMNPLAVDLRFVLAVLKINSNLERIGDIADGISRYVADTESPFDTELIQQTRIKEMFDTSISMLQDVLSSFIGEDTKMSRGIFKKDDVLDEINSEANAVIEKYIRANPDKIQPALNIISTIRKLERTGDQTKNIAEEIIFYIEAKVLKHVPGNKAL
jgi:phosphate transport system protein